MCIRKDGTGALQLRYESLLFLPPFMQPLKCIVYVYSYAFAIEVSNMADRHRQTDRQTDRQAAGRRQAGCAGRNSSRPDRDEGE